MKIAVVYNRESQKVINLFGMPNREKYGLKAIRRIVNSLKLGGHQVVALEGDKDLIDNLEEFMPRVLKGERPGLVFNLSYGIQGQARYTHVPGILEMVGIPYVGSGPLAHSLALDKVVAKMIFRQQGLPTPDFAVLDAPGFELPDLDFPLIVKPKNEAVSFGIKIVHNEAELREAADVIFQQFSQPTLVEQYIEGREINVGILGNDPIEAFEPAELVFGPGGPNIYTLEDKKRKSGREVKVDCPAQLPPETAAEAREISIKAFKALGCYDCARVDMRLDNKGNIYILEINSLPSLGEHGSYVAAAEQMGMDFPALINRLVEVASARYFGTPVPPKVNVKNIDPAVHVFSFLSEHRDQMEVRVKSLCSKSFRTTDIVGRQLAFKELDQRLRDLKMKSVPEFTNDKVVWTWETKPGLANGSLFVIHIDIPFTDSTQFQSFRRDPEWLYGEGIGSSWAPLTVLEFVLRSLRSCRRLHKLPVGVLCYADEGFDCRYSGDLIGKAFAKAKRILILRPGSPLGRVITERRGQRKYNLIVEGKPNRLGKTAKTPEVLQWLAARTMEMATLKSSKKRLAASIVDIKCDSFPLLLPHRVTATLLTSFPSKTAGDALEKSIRDILGKNGLKWHLELISDRPPLRHRKINNELFNSLSQIAANWDIPFAKESSVWPSVAGLVPDNVQVLCGLGPTTQNLYTTQERVARISMMQRALLLAEYLVQQLSKNERKVKNEKKASE